MRVILPTILLLSCILLPACGDDEDGGTSSNVRPTSANDDIKFYDVTHPEDGTRYRCLYTYVGGSNGGGPAMWCERRRPH
jgi:hypothetical protein